MCEEKEPPPRQCGAYVTVTFDLDSGQVRANLQSQHCSYFTKKKLKIQDTHLPTLKNSVS